MNIGILGAGNMGGRLARVWTAAGHAVRFGVPDPAAEKVRTLVDELAPAAAAGSNAEAARFGEVVVVACPWPSAREALAACGDALAGKVVIDVTNPLVPDLTALEVGHTTSAAEMIATWAPGARVVKAFNATAAAAIGNPLYDGRPATGFYAGDDPEAKATVGRLVAEAGFDPLDVGPLVAARHLEAFAMFWIHLAVGRRMGGDFALGIIRR